jgi:DNA-binding transcriptional ArsR family regulator
MKQEPTKAQVLDALQTHKTVQKAAKALGLSYPKMQHWLKKYGIVCNHNAKQVEPEEERKIINKLLRDLKCAVERAEETISDPNLIPRMMAKTFQPFKFKKGE